MHLAYLDDSDTKARESKWQVMAGVLVDGREFTMLEFAMGAVRDVLMPPDKLEKFEEFHACELYGGHGPFEGISQENRFDAIRSLISLLGNNFYKLWVVYGAVNIATLRSNVYGSADPLDMTFRMCCDKIQLWVTQEIKGFKVNDTSEPIPGEFVRSLEELILVIMDDCEDKKLKNQLQHSFRSRRGRDPKTKRRKGGLFNFHDDMFFGDSRYSAGIQLADLCAYFIAKHLEGDQETDGFYRMIEPHIAAYGIYPEVSPDPRTAPCGETSKNANESMRGIGELGQNDAPTDEFAKE